MIRAVVGFVILVVTIGGCRAAEPAVTVSVTPQDLASVLVSNATDGYRPSTSSDAPFVPNGWGPLDLPSAVAIFVPVKQSYWDKFLRANGFTGGYIRTWVTTEEPQASLSAFVFRFADDAGATAFRANGEDAAVDGTVEDLPGTSNGRVTTVGRADGSFTSEALFQCGPDVFALFANAVNRAKASQQARDLAAVQLAQADCRT
jgi:hypothetical protein